ncbi:uncharacterized protein LOC127253300 [Andrographis paniculata]|uniref:uncharacterized protein LOC127253300 n=1 Tax=Andrographis paniculata TaxID=175694 RepID=UPI0021E6FAAE|nr:uncharacterized protein LOC127253300 [Andrographis paniculata]
MNWSETEEWCSPCNADEQQQEHNDEEDVLAGRTTMNADEHDEGEDNDNSKEDSLAGTTTKNGDEHEEGDDSKEDVLAGGPAMSMMELGHDDLRDHFLAESQRVDRSNGGGHQETLNVLQSLKDVTHFSEDDIYATLLDCDMDLAQTLRSLFSQGPFKKVKSKPEKKKEVKSKSELGVCAAASSSQAGPRAAGRRVSEPPSDEGRECEVDSGSKDPPLPLLRCTAD